uniref:Uncharacterized protein n=1 Tax=Rhizophora mucronata TaxID=61149 RepID=A0A2P2IY60_RHIMU
MLSDAIKISLLSLHLESNQPPTTDKVIFFNLVNFYKIMYPNNSRNSMLSSESQHKIYMHILHINLEV